MHANSMKKAGSRSLIALGLVAIAAALMPVAGASAHRAAHRTAAKPAVVTKGSVSVKGGTASVVLSPTSTAALTGFGVTLAPLAPATATGATWTLPIVSGEIRYMTRSATGAPALTRITGGLVKLGGGINATRNGKSVAVTDIRGEMWEGSNGRIEATVTGVRHRIDVLMLSEPTIDAAKKTASANIRLTGVAAMAMNKALATTVFKGGQLVGTVSVTAP